jgi:hypothetical protein
VNSNSIKPPVSEYQRMVEEYRKIKLVLPPSSIRFFRTSAKAFKKVEPVSSYEGKIKELVIHLKNDENDSTSIENLIELFNAVRPEKLIVLTQLIVGNHYSDSVTANKFFKFLDLNKSKIDIVYTSADSPWIRDPFLPFYNTSSSVNTKEFLFKPYKIDGIYPNVAKELSMHRQFSLTKKIPLKFLSGNFLIGDDFILIGLDSILDTDEIFRNNRFSFSFLDWLSNIEIKGKRIKPIPIGAQSLINLKSIVQGPLGSGSEFNGKIDNSAQPLFHLDLFITLIGRQGEGERFIILLGYLQNASGQKLTEEEEDWIEKVNGAIKEIKIELESHSDGDRPKFEIIDTPIPLILEQKGQDRYWQPIAFNNGLVENINNNPKLYIPDFDLNKYQNNYELQDYYKIKTDFENILKKKKIQFSWVGDYFSLLIDLGALHCTTNILSRS